MRRALLATVGISVVLIAGYLLWGPDPQVTSAAADGLDEAREAAATLEAQGADATMCAAKLQRHFQLTADQTAEILCELSYDGAANAGALRVVYGLGNYDAARAIQRGGCDDWCGALDSVSVDADDLLGECWPNGQANACDPVFLFDAQTQCFDLVDLQAEDWLRGNGFEDQEYLGLTARPYVEKFAPALMFDQDATTFPMDAQKWFDQELCGEFGGPVATIYKCYNTFGATDIPCNPDNDDPCPGFCQPDPSQPPGYPTDAFADPVFGGRVCSQVATGPVSGVCGDVKPCNDDPWKCTTNSMQILRGKGECSVNGSATGISCLRDEDCGSEGCALAECKFPENRERYGTSALDYRIPTYYQVRRCGSPTAGTCGGTSYCSTGQLRIAYWWFYGYQQNCDDCSGDHRADWEHVVVTTSNDRRRIAAVTYSQHTGSYTKVHLARPAGDWESFLSYSEHPQCYADGERCEGNEDCDPHWQPGGGPQVCELWDGDTILRKRADGHPVVYAGKEQHGSYHDSGGSGSCFYFQDHRNPVYSGEERPWIDDPATGWATWESPLINLDGDEQGWIKHSRGRCRWDDHKPELTASVFWDRSDPHQVAEDHKNHAFLWGHNAIGTQPPRWEDGACALAACASSGCQTDKSHLYEWESAFIIRWLELPHDDSRTVGTNPGWTLVPPGGSLNNLRPWNTPTCTGLCDGGDRDGKLCEAQSDCPAGQCRGYACCEERPYENLDASDPWSSCVP